MKAKDVFLGCFGQSLVVGLSVLAVIFMDEIETAWFIFLGVAAVAFVLYILYSCIRKK